MEQAEPHSGVAQVHAHHMGAGRALRGIDVELPVLHTRHDRHGPGQGARRRSTGEGRAAQRTENQQDGDGRSARCSGIPSFPCASPVTVTAVAFPVRAVVAGTVALTAVPPLVT
ncbi:hypothetical protein GCM10020256_67960 [Streptomyces thermocoprophilus]